ncbi:MAG: hypothetical protein ACLS4Z_04090 [Christensenellaceae bacterium]
MGRIKKFYEENCLLKQPFIRTTSRRSPRFGRRREMRNQPFRVLRHGRRPRKKNENLDEEVAKQVAAMKK